MVLSIVLSFIGEGSTDIRFFPNIAERLIEQLLIKQGKQATIQWQTIEKQGEGSSEIIFNAAIQAKYCSTLIIHADADDRKPHNAYTHKIKPGIDAILQSELKVCKNITVVIPVSETEAWMLVDKELLKDEMNTTLSDQDLGLTYPANRIERIADPKQRIEDAIVAHRLQLPKRRRRSAVTIAELYEPISRRIVLQKLEILPSYKFFKENLITALRNKNILN